MIPAQAVEAAYDKYQHLGLNASDIEGILKAAAPHIRAQALEDAANSRETERLFMFGWEARERLRTRAAAERGVE